MIFTTDLTDFLIPKITGYNPEFGTMKESGGLTTQEVSNNIMYPLKAQQGFIVTENSSTTQVKRDSKFIVTQESTQLTIGSGTDGVEVCVFNKSEGNCTVIINNNPYTLKKGRRCEIQWIIDSWEWKTDVDLLCPKGYIYTQYPMEKAPWELFDFTLEEQWQDISSHYAGLFARIDGGNASQFNKQLTCTVSDTTVTFENAEHGVDNFTILIDPNTWEQRQVTEVNGATATIKEAFSNSSEITFLLIAEREMLPNVRGAAGLAITVGGARWESHVGIVNKWESFGHADGNSGDTRQMNGRVWFDVSMGQTKEGIDYSVNANSLTQDNYKTLSESSFKDGGETRPSNFTVRVWKRIS